MSKPKYICTQQTIKDMVELLAAGCLPVEVAGAMGLPQSTWDAWLNPKHDEYNEDFAHAFDVGMVKCQAWWIKQGRVGMTDRTFNYSAWAAVMKQAFAWQDKTTVEQVVDDKEAGRQAIVDWFRTMTPEERAAVVEYRRETLANRLSQ
jgi:predicted KAP-like P-loop ATPase